MERHLTSPAQPNVGQLRQSAYGVAGRRHLMVQGAQPVGHRDGNSLRSLPSWATHVDLAVVCALAALAGLAYAVLPGGAILRVALAVAILFFVPGYALIEAMVGPAATRRQRIVRGFVAIGASPPLIGLLALATVALPGGFRPASIVVTVLLASIALAGVAFWRRRRAPTSDAALEAVAA